MFGFTKNTDGHVAVTFALLGIPLALAGTLALDSYSSQGEHSRLQAALDGAVLATVSNGTLDNATDRESYARDRFASNYDAPATLTFTDDGSVVHMTAHAKYDTMLGGIVNRQSLDLRAESAGTLSKGRTICVLGLAEEGEGVVKFDDSAYFKAFNCGVQVNSSDTKALISTSTNAPQAESFCVRGGASGQFSPAVNSQCEAVKDPFASLTSPTPQQCRDMTGFTRIENGIIVGTIDTAGELLGTGLEPTLTNTNTLTGGLIDPLTSLPQDAVSSLTGVLTGSNVTIEPGTYCEPLIIDGYNVDFPPGQYHFLQGVRFLNGSEARADNVSFILEGAHTPIQIDTGAQLYMKAPPNGGLAGLALVQTPYEYRQILGSLDIEFVRHYGEGTFTPTDPEKAYSFLRSGGRLDVIGTVYLPQQTLEVSGDSIFGAQSQTTSFIANKVWFKDRMHANIKVDHEANGLPPVEPRVETSPRLIK